MFYLSPGDFGAIELSPYRATFSFVKTFLYPGSTHYLGPQLQNRFESNYRVQLE